MCCYTCSFFIDLTLEWLGEYCIDCVTFSLGHSPPLRSPNRESVSSQSGSVTPPSPTKTQPLQQFTFSGHQSAPLTATKSSSPKSAIKKAFTTMKRIGSKKRSKRRTLEISGPILVNEEIPSFVAQREVIRQRAFSEGSPLQALQYRSAENNSQASATPSESSGMPRLEKQSKETLSPPLPGRSRQGYQNYPFSKAGDTLERPQKPPRMTKAGKPLADKQPESICTNEKQPEEPAYLQPSKDELTFKVEAALANLNDATILAEALSRVEQEKLGPLPDVPKSRHVRFQIEATDTSKTPAIAGSKPDLPKRPAWAVSPTLVNGVSRKSELPKLPSRPPNTKPTQGNHRGRSQSVKEARNSDYHAAGVVRSRSLSTTASMLEHRYNKILKLQMQTLEEVVNSCRASLLPAKELDLRDTQWCDYEVCGDALSVQCPDAVLLPVKCRKVTDDHKLLAKVGKV